MSTTTKYRSTGSGLSFGGILKSEWIKLTTLRSTVWCLAIVVVVTIGLGILLAFTFSNQGNLPTAQQQQATVQVSTLAIGFSQLAVSVLGALVITGEYGTGMIRSTFAAAPGRFSPVLAKALVFAAVIFGVSLISIGVTALITAPLLPNVGVHPDFGDAGVYWALLGGAGYLALIGLFAFALGTIIRNSAGAIAAALGTVLVLPGILQLIGALTKTEWVTNLTKFLPSGADRMYAYAIAQPAVPGAPAGAITLDPWQGLLLIVVWDVVLLAIGMILVKRRDA